MESKRRVIGWHKTLVLALAVIVVVGVPGSKPVKAECQDVEYTYSSIWNACFAGGTGGCECVDVYG